MRKGIKILAMLIATLLLLMIFLPFCVALLLQIPRFQTVAADWAMSWAGDRLGVEVRMDRLRVGFFNRVEVDGFYVGDYEQDTMLYAAHAEVSIARLGIFGDGIVFDDAILQDAKFHLRESPRGAMNVKEVVERMRPAQKKEKQPFVLRFRHLEAAGLEFWLKRNEPRRHETGVDWADMQLKDIWAHLSDFEICKQQITMSIDRLSADEKSGFRLDNLSGGLVVDRGRIAMAGVEILTPLSSLHIPTLAISGDGWEQYKDFVDHVVMEVQVEDSSLATEDVAYFAPSLQNWHLFATHVDLDVSGTVNHLMTHIRSFETPGGMSLVADLQMRGLPEVDRTQFDLKLHSLQTSAQEIEAWSGALMKRPLSSSLLTMLSRAGEMELSGRFLGRFSDFSAQALAATDLGTLSAEATMERLPEGNYDLVADASTRKFRVGHLLHIKELEQVSLQAKARGMLTGQGPDLRVDADLIDLIYREVPCDTIHVAALLKGKNYQARLRSNSEVLDFDLDAEADLSELLPRYRVDMALRNADLAALKINRRDSISRLSLRMEGEAQVASDLNEVVGELSIRDARYQYNDSLIVASELTLLAQKEDEQRELTFSSPFTDLSFRTSLGFTAAFSSLREALLCYVPHLYTEEEKLCHHHAGFRYEDFTSVEARLKHLSPLTHAIFKQLDVADHTQLCFTHHPASGALNLTLHSDFLEQANMLALDLNLKAHNEADSLLVEASVGNLLIGKLHIDSLKLAGGARDSHFRLQSSFVDSLHLMADVAMHGQVAREEGVRRLILAVDPSSLTMGNKHWQMVAPRVEIDTSRVLVNRFRVFNPEEELLLDGIASRSREDSIRLTLRNFDLSVFSQITSTLGYRISGISNGFASAKSALYQSEITADIEIDSMAINDRIRVAPIELLSQWDFEKNQAGLYIVNRELRDTVIRGYYLPTEGRYAARLHLDTLPISLLDPLLTGVISETKGSAKVDLLLLGKGRKVTLQGDLYAQDLSTQIDYTRVTYRIPEAHIEVADNRFVAYRVPVFDGEGNRGELDFQLDLNRLSNIAYRLSVSPNQMLVLDTSEKDNDLFYGHIYATGRALIQGDKKGVRMQINASTDDNSVFYMPLSGSSNVAKADFVTFLSPEQLDTTDYLLRRRLMFERRNSRKQKGSGNMDISMALNVHPNVDFQLVIDPQAGDLMRGRGEGLLNLHINPKDNIFEMLGDYVIQEGSYLFTLQNVINKKFLIESGSSIQWTGEPMDAMLNINAIYKLKTSLYPLLGATSDDRNANTRTVPVECVIHLGDRLSNPSKAFSIRVPQADSETQTAVANILNTETTIARQFIYLLAFNSFYPENATGSIDNIGAVATAATGFELLANQVGNLLSGDDYNIILRYRPETELTGEEVDFGLSTNLINNRLLVEVEGNYIIDNKQATMNNMSNFMGEAYITWMIDRAGNLKLRGFTQTIDRFDETQGLQETGIGIYYKEDFDNFRDWREQLKARFSSEKRRQRAAERKMRRKERQKMKQQIEERELPEVVPMATGYEIIPEADEPR